MAYSIAQIDMVRERMGVGYAEAKAALDAADGDVILALVAVEKIQQQRRLEAAVELEAQIVGGLQEVRRLVAGGRIEKMRVKIGDQAVQVVPGAVAGVGAVVLTIVGALLSLVSVETEIESQAETNQSISR